MRGLFRPAALAPVTALVAILAIAGAAAHPTPAIAAPDLFYTNLLVEGRLALARRDYTSASKDLRTASFGLLDEPATLAEALVLLAISQAGNGADSAFRETFGRLLEVEQRFLVYDGAGLTPAERTRFEDEARRRIAPAVLNSAPTFERWAKVEEKPEKPTRERRRREPKPSNEPAAPQAPQATPPQPMPPQPTPALTPQAPSMAPRPSPVPQAPAPIAAAIEPPPPPPAPVPGPTAEELAALQTARRRMEGATALADLGPAIDVTFPIADRYPAAQVAQRLAMELSYRGSRWTDVVRFAARIPIDPAVDPALCFYAGVGEAELGHREAAGAWLRRCGPYLERTPVVLRYLDLIEGAPR